VLDGLKSVSKPFFDREHPRLAVAQDMRDSLGGRGEMRCDYRRPEVGGRHGCDRQLRPVVRPEGDAIAVAHTRAGERAGQAFDGHAKLRPGQVLAAARRAQRHPIGDASDARLKGEPKSVRHRRDGRLGHGGCVMCAYRCHTSTIAAAASTSPH